MSIFDYREFFHFSLKNPVKSIFYITNLSTYLVDIGVLRGVISITPNPIIKKEKNGSKDQNGSHNSSSTDHAGLMMYEFTDSVQ